MAIEYPGGTIVNTTFTTTTGTRREIVDGIVAALTSAGWSTASGAGTGDVKMDSAITPSPQSLQMRVRIYDPGSGNCARVRISNVGETVAPAVDNFLLPVAGDVWRVIAHQYGAYVFVPATSHTPGNGRKFTCFGLPFLPTRLRGVITEAMFMNGSGSSDTDATLRSTFRTSNGVTDGTQVSLVNGSANTTGFSNQAQPGLFHLVCPCGPAVSNSAICDRRWHDNTYLVYDPLISWGLTGPSVEGLIRGQLWGALVVAGQQSADSTFTYDGHDWYVLTYNSAYYNSLCLQIT